MRSERVSSASERANGQASGPVLTSLFLFVPDHSAMTTTKTTSRVDNNGALSGKVIETGTGTWVAGVQIRGQPRARPLTPGHGDSRGAQQGERLLMPLVRHGLACWAGLS